MEKVLALLAAVLMTFAFSTIGFAQGYDTMGTPQGEPWPEKSHHATNEPLMKYSGQVLSYDASRNRLLVNGVDGEKSFDVSQAAINGSRALEPNHHVTVTYRDTNNGRIASSVASVSHTASSANTNTFRGGGYGYMGYGVNGVS